MPVSFPLQHNSTNRLITGLSPADFALLHPYLELTVLTLNKWLIQRDAPIERVYFVECGIVSWITSTRDGEQIELGLVGNEGLVGLPIVLGTDQTPHEALVQTPGLALSILAQNLSSAMQGSHSLHAYLLRYVQAVTVQIAGTALSNGRYAINQRLARWLLMCHDRTDGDVLPTTHQFLSLMLGVRRSGVTNTVRQFIDNGLIATKRGIITIVDRDGLVALAGSSYGDPEIEYERLLGSQINVPSGT